MNAAGGALLWSRRDRLAVAVLQGLGFALLALSWLGVSGTTRFSRQIAWANLGGAGLVAVVLGAAVLVRRGRRQVSLRIGAQPWPVRVSGTMVAALAVDGYVSAPGMTRYHRPGCQAVAGKSVSSVGPEGRQPCGMCI